MKTPRASLAILLSAGLSLSAHSAVMFTLHVDDLTTPPAAVFVVGTFNADFRAGR